MSLSVSLLGAARIEQDGKETQLVKAMRLLVAYLVTQRPGPEATDQEIASAIGINLGHLRVLRNRILSREPLAALLRDPAEVRWGLTHVALDVDRARELAARARNPWSTEAERDRREALALLAHPLLGGEEPDEPRWLVSLRAELASLHAELIQLGDSAGRTPAGRRPALPPDNLGAQLDPLVAREDELADLERHFGASETPRPFVLSGPPGVGKTSLALGFARRSPHHWGRWLVSAHEGTVLRDGLRQLADALDLPTANAGPPIAEPGAAPVFLRDLAEYLVAHRDRGRLLLVVDGLDGPSRREAIGPELIDVVSGAVDLIITSQGDALPRDVEHRRLEPFSRAEAVRLLEERRSPVTPDVDELLAQVPLRPLMIEQMAVAAREQEVDLDQILQRRDTAPEEPERQLRDPVPERAFIAYNIDRLARRRRGAVEALEVVAHLGAAPLDCAVLAREHRDTLVEENLLDLVGSDRCVIHPAIREAVLARVSRAERRPERLMRAIETVRGEATSQERSSQALSAWCAPMEAVVAHVERLAEEERTKELEREAAQLCRQVARVRRRQGEWGAAEGAYRRAQTLVWDDRPLRALYAVRLANTLRQRGQFERAREILATALPQLEPPAPGVSDEDRAWALSVSLKVQRATSPDSLEATADLLERAADRHPGQSVNHGELGREYAELTAQLVNVHRQLGDYPRARRRAVIGARALHIDLEAVAAGGATPQDPRAAALLRAYGNLLRAEGRLRPAITVQEVALGLTEEAKGPEHIAVVRGLDSLGRAQRDHGLFAEALETFQRALATAELLDGPGSHAATAAVNLALTYAELERRDEALEWARRGFAAFKRLHGDPYTLDHGGSLASPNTAWAVFAYAEIRRRLPDAQDLAAAEQHHLAVLEYRKQLPARGPEHPHVASSRYALGEVERCRLMQASRDADREGHRASALALHESALDSRRAFFNEESHWVALSELRVGQIKGDHQLLGQAERTLSSQLMPTHWRLRLVRGLIADLTERTGPTV